MWSRAALSLSLLVLVTAQGADFSENADAQANDLGQVGREENNNREDVVLQEHHLSKHTKSHNPCTFRHCTSRQVCKVVVNPALQFPVAHCEDAFSLAGAAPTSVATTAALSCDAAELSTNPMACRAPGAWEQHARDHCGKAKMSSFKVSTACLSFDPTPVYQFASFQCCRPRTAPAQQPPPSKQQADTASAKPEHKATTQMPATKAPAKKTAAKQLPKTTLPPQKKPIQKAPEDKPPTTPPPPPPPSQKSQTPAETKAIPKTPVTNNQKPEEPESPTGRPQDDTQSAKLDVHPERKDGVDDEETIHDLPEGDRIQKHWFGVLAAGVVVVIVVVILGVVVRMTRRQQVLHKPHHLLSDARGATLKFPRRRSGDDDEDDILSPGADGLVFDDMEVQNFVNPVAMYANAAAVVDDEPATIEPFDIQHWEMDGNAMCHHQQHITNKT